MEGGISFCVHRNLFIQMLRKKSLLSRDFTTIAASRIISSPRASRESEEGHMIRRQELSKRCLHDLTWRCNSYHIKEQEDNPNANKWTESRKTYPRLCWPESESSIFPCNSHGALAAPMGMFVCCIHPAIGAEPIADFLCSSADFWQK